MTPRQDLLKQIIYKDEDVILANGKSILSIGRGQIGPFKDIMIIPTLPETLISVGSLADNGLTSLYYKNTLDIFNLPLDNPETRVVLTAYKDNSGLYYFDDIERVFNILSDLPECKIYKITTRSGKELTEINPHIPRALPYNLDLPKVQVDSTSEIENIQVDNTSDTGSITQVDISIPELRNNQIETSEVVDIQTDRLVSEISNLDKPNQVKDSLYPTSELGSIGDKEISENSIRYIDKFNNDNNNNKRSISISKSQDRLNYLQQITGMSKLTIKRLCIEGAVDGINICPKYLPYLNYENSSDWYIGHMKDKHMNISSNPINANPLYLICVDIGPRLPPNNSGKNYPFFFIDRATNKMFIYFNKSKDKFIDIINKFYNEVVLQSNHIWKNLQSDGDTVILDDKVICRLRDLNVNYQTSAPYKHGQNGFIERNIGFLYNVARMFMNQLKVSSQFLGEALIHACYMLNRARIPRRMNKTPEEAFTGIKPNLINIPIFYQYGIGYNSKEEREGKGKMYPKAQRYRFLGIPSHYKDSYLVFNPNNCTVKVRHDVHWFKDQAKMTTERALK
jgi:hypothetical protein